MDIRKAMKIASSADATIKLSKMATTIMNGDRKIVDKSLKNIKLTDWLGLAQNPLLTDGDIRDMYASMADQNKEEKTNGTKEATRTRNMGSRGKVRKLLSLHPNIASESIDDLLKSRNIGSPKVLNNPKISSEQLNNYFEQRVMSTATKNDYNFISFGDLMKTINITKTLALKWYKRLSTMSDWTYKDNKWYAIVDAFLDFEDCPYEILVDICNAPPGQGGNEFNNVFNKPEKYREEAIKHLNAKPELVQISFDITGFEQYLPQEAKDIFLF